MRRFKTMVLLCEYMLLILAFSNQQIEATLTAATGR
jgi:hypothetical protein